DHETHCDNALNNPHPSPLTNAIAVVNSTHHSVKATLSRRVPCSVWLADRPPSAYATAISSAGSSSGRALTMIGGTTWTSHLQGSSSAQCGARAPSSLLRWRADGFTPSHSPVAR